MIEFKEAPIEIESEESSIQNNSPGCSKIDSRAGSCFSFNVIFSLHTVWLLIPHTAYHGVNSEKRSQSDCSIWDRALVDLFKHKISFLL